MGIREDYVAQVKQKLGIAYRYGGKGPLYDCSGTVTVSMRGAGMNIGDHNANELSKIFSGKDVPYADALPGTLCFYGDSPETVDHVMTVIERWADGYLVLAGAHSGGATTTTLAAAEAAGAMVGTVPQSYWSSKRQLVLDPFKEV